MSENVKINIDLGAQLAEGVKQSAQLRANLEAAAKIRLNIIGGSGGSTISNKLPNNNSQQSGQGVTKTSRSIGQGAGTGSATSDFAAQAQGLGGLVHVYATFAANIFALSAAFSALSKAADVSSLSKGLDQLGASSGRALGSLAKRLVEVTDGALSMQDALRSTAISSSGGLSDQAILRLTEVAKKASIALGRDLPDSMDRLTKGIIKIQPELLDELGIMTRVIPAQEAYARSIGKSVAGLTEFEKRQAFTNAVLAEGERKFNAINLQANPYSAILASIQNITQAGLEIVNKVLSPLVSLLSASPTALAIAIGGLSAVLLKQAVPAIGLFKESLRNAAENTKNVALAKASEARKGYSLSLQEAKKAAEARADIEAEVVANAEAKLATLKSASPKSRVAVNRILSKDLHNITEDDIKEIELIAKKQKNNKASADAHNEVAQAIRGHAAAEQVYRDKVTESTKSILDNNNALNTSKSTQIIANRELIKSVTQGITSQAAQTGSTLGFVAAIKEANAAINLARKGNNTIDFTDKFGNLEKIAVPALSKMQGGWTLVKAGISGATGAITTFLSFVGPWVAVIGIVVAIASELYDAFFKSEKQAKSYTTSLTSLSEAGENVSRTLEAISKKSLGEAFSAESIQARATAFLNLSDAVTSGAQSFRDLINVRGSVESFVDYLYGIVGLGDSDKLAKSMGSSISKSFALLEGNPLAKKSAEDAIKSLLGDNIDLSSEEAIVKVLKKLGDTDLASKVSAVSEIFKKTSQNINNTASSLTSFSESLSAVGKLVTETNAKLTPQDDQSKIGSGLLSSSIQLTEVLKNGPIDSLAAFNKLVKDTQVLSLLPKDEVLRLFNANKELESIGKQISANSNNIKLAEDTLKNLPKTGTVSLFSDPGDLAIKQREEALESQKKVVSGLRNESLNLISSAKKAADVLANVPILLFTKGSTLLLQGLQQGLVESSVLAGKAYLNVIKSAGGDTAVEEGRLRQMEIDVQTQVINSQYESIRAMATNTLALDEVRLSNERLALETKIKEQKGSDGVGNLLKSLDEFNAKAVGISKQRELLTNSPKEVINQLKTATALGASAGVGVIEAFKAQKGLIEATVSQQKSLALQSAKSTENSLIIQAGTISETAKKEDERYQKQIDSNTVLKERAVLEEQYYGGYNEILTADRQSLENAIAKDSAAKSLLATQTKIRLLTEVAKVSEPNKDTKYENLSKNQQALVRARTELASKQKNIDSEAVIRGKKQFEDTLSRIEVQRKKEAGINLERLNDNYALNSATLQAQNNNLDYLNNISAISKETYANRRGEIDLSIQENSYLTERATIDNKYAADAAEKSKQIAIAENNEVGSSALLVAELANIDTHYLNQLNILSLTNATKVTSLKLATAEESAIAKQVEQMDKMKSTTESLAAVFGIVGDNIGKLSEAILKLSQDTINYEKQKKALEGDPKALLDLDNKFTSIKLKNTAEISKATKGIFKEEQIGYKVLDTLEKGSHLLKLYNDNQELVSTIFTLGKKAAVELGFLTASTAAEEVADTAKAVSKIPGVIMSFMQALGPYGTAAAGIAIAAVLGGVGGGGSAPIGPSAAERQQTQGTGQSYNSSNQLVENGGGVLGDISAKSKSIDNSLDTVAKTSVENLTYANKMLDALNSIKTNISAAATALFKTSGLNKKGGGTGIIEGTVTGDNLISSAINSNLITAVSDKLLGGALSSIANDLFGSSETTTILDQGIKFSGTFRDILSGVSDSLQLFTTRSVEWERGFWDSGTDIGTVVRSVDDSVSSAIRGIFSSAADMFSSQGEQLGKSTELVMATLARVDISRMSSLHGLQGEALTEAFTDSINGILDDAAKTVYPELMRFQKGGEAAFETVSRVLDSSYKIKVAFDSIGKSTTMLSKGLIGYNITEGLSEAAGGLDNLLSQVKQFGDDFLSESERLAPVQKNLVAQLSEMGYASIDTREEFKQLILGFEFTGRESYKMYESLLALAPAFNAVYKASEKVRDVLDAIEYSSTVTDMLVKYLNLIGDSKGAVQLAREKELSTMDERLVGAQKYLYALEDENSARTKLSTIIKDTITNIKSAIKSLKEYKTALTLGDKNTLTPTDQYIATKANLKSISAVASLIATTDAEKVVQSEALAKLPAASDAFLEASRTLYASSDKYTQDFQSVLDIVDSTTGALSAQQSTAELQLTQLQTSARSLGIIEENTYTTVQLLEQYLVLANTAATAKVGVPTGYVAPVGTPSATGATTSATTSASTSASTSTAPPTTDPRIPIHIPGMPTIYINPTLGGGGSAVTQGSTSDAETQMARLMNVYGWTSANASENAWGMYYSRYATQKDIAARTGQTAAEVSSAFSLYGIPAFRNGGLANGISLVGEQGPEIVDFRTPGRVYSNNASNDMFNNKELVAEIKALRQEVVQLRKEQKEQTGHLINSNYDANGQVATAVKNTADANSNNNTWIARSIPKIA